MTVLWQPSPEQVRHANLTAFRRFVTHRHGIDVESYADLHAWSIAHIPEFWDAVWDFCEVIGDKGDIILDPGKHMLEARFFPDARLNGGNSTGRCRGCRRRFAIPAYRPGTASPPACQIAPKP